ncbi:MAG TPA: TatD family hydrolase [Blastocatellia bacterium]|nr:TatD family hydrolase [Blastocatellia bacterium]
MAKEVPGTSRPNSLIDIGVNLTHRSFDRDRDEVICRARDAGVLAMIVTGTDLQSSGAAAELASMYPGVLYSTAGVHPHNAKSCGADTIVQLRALAARREVVAIGECGLDFNRDFSPRAVQEQWFEAQLQLAADLGLPVFLHERDAGSTFTVILRNHRNRISAAVVHCYTGTASELKTYLDLGCHIGITGWICDERRGTHLVELIRWIPPDRLMVETDAPFLTPRNLTPKPLPRRNEPSFLSFVVAKIAECTGRPIAQVASDAFTCTKNFFRLPDEG